MVFTVFFAIINPIANLPVFLGLVEGEDKKTISTIAEKRPLLRLSLSSFLYCSVS